MKSPSWSGRSLMAAMVLWSMAALAQEVQVLPTRAVQVNPATAEVAGELLASAYAKASGRAVTGPSALVEGQVPKGVELIESRLIGIDGTGTGRMMFSADRRTADGRPAAHAELVVASASELDKVAERLAVALAKELPAERTRSLRTITANEARPETKLQAKDYPGIKAGAMASLSRFAPMTTGSVFVRKESENRFVEFGMGLLIPAGSGAAGSYGGLVADVSGNLYLSEQDISPYVGVGVSPRLIFGGGSPANLSVFGQGGLAVGRFASSRFFVEARFAQSVTPVQNRYPTELGGSLGLTF